MMIAKNEEDKESLVKDICSMAGVMKDSEVFKFLELSQ